MNRRWILVWGILLLPLFWLTLWHTEFSKAQPPSGAAIINEWSQGAGGSQEWVELLVVTGPLDMRGWDLGDSSPGDLTFTNDGLWSAVPRGARIVIYNGSDRDGILPPDDSDSGDCLLVLPHSAGDYFSGGWPALANSNNADNPHLRDAGGATVHDFSAAPGGLHPGGGQSVAYQGDTAAGVANAGQWQKGAASGASPGAGNGGANTAWVNGLCSGEQATGPDVTVSKSGPPTAAAGGEMVYTLSARNVGQAAATDVVLTDRLPDALTYVSDDSVVAVSEPIPGLLLWSLGDLAPGASVEFALTVQVASGTSGDVRNEASVALAGSERNTANNTAVATTRIGAASSTAGVLLDAVLYDGYANGDADEAVALRNVDDTPADLGGWAIGDGGASTAVLPEGTTLAPGAVLWVTRDATAFARQFGFAPDVAAAAWPGFANSGDEVVLLDATGEAVDVLVYEGGDVTTPGWLGPALEPYAVRGVFGAEGQILYRKRDQATGQPVPDTNQAADWSQARDDAINGRKVRYPGWDLDRYFFTKKFTETAELRIAVAPDNAFAALVAELSRAQRSIQIETLTFENLAVADALIAAARRGVAVTVLLEGGPAGGIANQERYICQELEAVGAQCWFVISDDGDDVYDRYRFMHAKFVIIDGERGVISSENMSPNSLPNDDKRDGTYGRRGVLLITDAPGVVGHLQDLFAHDFDPANHADLFRWQAGHPTYGNPSEGYVPVRETGGITYTVRYPAPRTLRDTFAFEIVQSPENSLRDADGLLGLVGRVGQGDTLLVQQLQERPYWGATTSNPQVDPNPRLEAYIAAARRGAAVTLQLDAFFDAADSPVSNSATCTYVNTIARDESLQLACVVANPTGLGIHNKMVLAQIDGRGFIHVGSLNGTEQASKGNRELALQVQSDEAYAFLADVFVRDMAQPRFLPLVISSYQGPARHVLISEVLYDPFGPDEAEFIELVNPTLTAVDLSGYKLGDAMNRDDFEDVRRFPPGTVLLPGETLVVATSAAAFFVEHGTLPDFEILDTETTVPELIDDPTWGDTKALLQLGNAGDEVVLRRSDDAIVDALAYGVGSVPGVVACPLVTAANHSLERMPYWRDTNDCTADFRDWPFPSPGKLP